MVKPESAAHADAWALVEREKQRDRFLRRVSVGAWALTFAWVLVFGVATGARLAETARRVDIGVVPSSAIVDVAMPFVLVLGVLSVLVATLSTVGIFLRLRTASLTEIQVRLAALEDILVSRPDTPESTRG